MRHRSRAFAQVCATSGLILAAPVMGGASAPAQGVPVTISVTDLRNAEGVVMACMTTDPDRFPRCRDDADSYRQTVPADGNLRLHFPRVRPGTYAVALLHDENGNGKADRALSMIPREGFGFSRDAKVSMGPPDFEDAAFEVGAAPVSQAIRMRYML